MSEDPDDFLTEADIQDLDEIDKREEQAKKEIKVDEDEWSLADEDDIKEIRVRKISKVYLVPLDLEKQTYVKLFMRDASVEEQMAITEALLAFDEKKGLRLDMRSYYKLIWNRLVTKTIPPIKFNEVRFFETKFGNRLLKYLPNPIELLGEQFSGVTREEEKNLEQLSEKGSTT